MPKKPKTKKIKDTDYLTISAQIRGMENTLMNRDKMEQLLEAHPHPAGVRLPCLLPGGSGRTGRGVLQRPPEHLEGPGAEHARSPVSGCLPDEVRLP